MKIKHYISADRIISCIQEIGDIGCNHFCIIDKERICVVKKISHAGANQIKTVIDIDLCATDIDEGTIYRSVSHNLNTNDFGGKQLIKEQTVRGALGCYVDSMLMNPHILVYKKNGTILVKSTYHTLFINSTYPMVVNKKISDIVITEFPEEKDNILQGQKRLVDFFDRHI